MKQMSSVTRVIFHADAFGLHPAINEGIERAHRYGLVTSTSVAAVGDALEDAVGRARRLPLLDMGLHFMLTGLPGLPADPKHFLLNWLRGDMPVREIAGQLRRQLDLLRRVHHLSLSHIVTHQHLSAFPPVMRVICAVAMEYDVPAVRLPCDDTPLPRSVPTVGKSRRPASLRALTRLSRRYVRAYGRRTTNSCTGLAVEGHLTPPALAGYLRHARPGVTELVCHPGTDNRVLRQAFGGDWDWERELQALCDPAARHYVTSGQVAPATWRDV